MRSFCLFPNSTASVWVTVGGDRIPIVKMEDFHLRHTIDYLRRRTFNLKQYVCAFHKFDEGERDKLFKVPTEKFLRQYVRSYPALIKEARRRKFKRIETRITKVQVPY